MDGWLFARKSGPKKSQSALDKPILALLVKIQEESSDLIKKNLNVQDINGIFPSCRRGSTTEVRNAKLVKEVIDLNNSWSLIEKARGKHP